MAHVIRDAVDTYLADDLASRDRDQVREETFGSIPDLATRVPSRDEWERGFE